MRIWIDNTGLQSAAQCLDGLASMPDDLDVRGLLQLATLIIYSDRVLINGFENPTIAKRSAEVVSRLDALGITDVVSVSPVTEPEYALGCRTAANSIAEELCDAFDPNERALVGGGPPDAPRGLRERQIAAIALATEPDGSARLRHALAHALEDKAIGAVEFMLAGSSKLRHAVRKAMARYPNWTANQSYQLNIFLRYHLNAALGEQAFSNYAPAIARAELIRRDNQNVIAMLGDTADQIVTELRGEPLGVPSTLAALLERSKGEPSSVLKAAMDLRQRSGPLRQMLGKLAARHSDDTPSGRFELHRAIGELGQQLRRDVGLDKTARFSDAIEFRMIVGVLPSLSLSGKEVMKWLAERRKSQKTAVLTELVKNSAFSGNSTNLYSKLRAESTKSLRSR